jgi:nitrate/nitrite transporter NarK
MQTHKSFGSISQIILLILAGESIFILPFVIPRIFRPTYLDVFKLTNLELGTCFSIYGIVALLSYLYGGTLADKYSPRKLIVASLLLTASGGVVISNFPSVMVLQFIYGYWGFTTIFLFWGAMIKATRIWGGASKQGIAFGFLEGGRGFVAATIGAIGVYIFSIILPDNFVDALLIERQNAFSNVILFAVILACSVGVCVFFFMKDPVSTKQKIKVPVSSIENIKKVLKIPSIWCLMFIVLSAYVGYKLTGIFSLYAKEIMLFNELEAAKIGTFQIYIRPVLGVIIGLMADKSRGSLLIIMGFITMLIGSLVFASGIIHSDLNYLFFLSLIITATGVYSIRTLYFAVLQEGKIPISITGTAVGLISVIGYTPDIFVGPAIGYLLDHSPGIVGHQQVFLMLAVFSGLGLFASIKFSKLGMHKME